MLARLTATNIPANGLTGFEGGHVLRELEIAIDAATRAGDAVRKVYHQGDFLVTHKEHDKSPLTQADLASNTTLAEILRNAFPHDGWLSEESEDTDERLSQSRVWIVDPLDGTREFTLRVPEFAVSVGLAIHGRAVLGVIFNPVTNELIAGADGLGCKLNQIGVQTTTHGDLVGARFLASRSESEAGGFGPWRDKIALQPMGSVAYKLGLVAAGKFDGTFTPNPRSEWDVCAGAACIAAAGGSVGTRTGKPYAFNKSYPRVDGVVGTNPHLFQPLLELLA